MTSFVYRSTDRGKTELDWLSSRHSFSFGDFVDPARTNFGSLRVLNEDVVAPGAGFGMHRHHHMEIISLVLQGALLHTDSTGHESVIKAGEVQRMSAGTGIMHSEMNASKTDPVHFLQIWITPKTKLVEPSHEQKTMEQRENALTLIASPDESDEVLTIRQDARLYIGVLETGRDALHTFTQYRHGAYIFVLEGSIYVENQKLHVRDAIAVSEVPSVKIEALENSKFVLIDVPL
jgi:quercetin 2,3-dioxygenase